MKKAKENLSAVLTFNRYGLLMGIFMNSQEEADQAILMKGLRLLLGPDKELLKKILKGFEDGRN